MATPRDWAEVLAGLKLKTDLPGIAVDTMVRLDPATASAYHLRETGWMR